ncbi:MAG: DUF1338 domain-containing protein [Spirosomataceae bacterium]
MHETLTIVMEGLMRRYRERVPDVMKIATAMQAEGLIQSFEDIENDHVAFRTLGVPHLGIASFEKIFLAYGYEKRDYFHFEGKKLNAYWFAPPSPKFPRIFVSELRVWDLPEPTQGIIQKYTASISSDPVDSLDLSNGYQVDAFLHQPLWDLPSWEDFETLQAASEYAAWVIYNRYYLNHYTISVHNLPLGYDDIYRFNEFLVRIGVRLNDAGGIVKVSPDGGLLQSSTVAEMIDATFAGGDVHRIAGSYVEFAERKILPAYQDIPKDQITRAHRRDGFETGNADKIFESTFTTQTNK